MHEVESERERRWKAEQATKRLIDHIKSLQSEGQLKCFAISYEFSIATIDRIILVLQTHTLFELQWAICSTHSGYDLVISHLIIDIST